MMWMYCDGWIDGSGLDKGPMDVLPCLTYDQELHNTGIKA